MFGAVWGFGGGWGGVGRVWAGLGEVWVVGFGRWGWAGWFGWGGWVWAGFARWGGVWAVGFGRSVGSGLLAGLGKKLVPYEVFVRLVWLSRQYPSLTEVDRWIVLL